MGGTTPVYGWPYPTGTDLVSQGDNAMQSLATAIENTVAGAVQTYTPALYNGMVPGNGLLAGWYKLLAPKVLQLWIGYSVNGTFSFPAHIQFGLPAGMVAAVTGGRVQSLLLRYYTGSSSALGWAVMQTAYGSGDRVALLKGNGTVLGGSDLALGANLDINGVVNLA